MFPKSLPALRADIFPFVPASLVNDTMSSLARLEGLLEKFLGRTFRSPPRQAWNDFFSLSSERQKTALEAWNAQSSFLSQVLEHDIESVDEPAMLQFAMGYLKLLGNSDIFSNVEKDDLVEIISPDFLQVYRSYSYFSLCNYSLLELGVYPFFELYDRSSHVQALLMERGGKILRGEARCVDLSDLPEYTIRELKTKERALFSMRERLLVKTVSMVTGEMYVISVKKVRALDRGPSNANIRFI